MRIGEPKMEIQSKEKVRLCHKRWFSHHLRPLLTHPSRKLLRELETARRRLLKDPSPLALLRECKHTIQGAGGHSDWINHVRISPNDPAYAILPNLLLLEPKRRAQPLKGKAPLLRSLCRLGEEFCRSGKYYLMLLMSLGFIAFRARFLAFLLLISPSSFPRRSSSKGSIENKKTIR
ncbi:hypothetical protein U1Q18_044000 [Sarracenia purpurea var. burkii]